VARVREVTDLYHLPLVSGRGFAAYAMACTRKALRRLLLPWIIRQSEYNSTNARVVDSLRHQGELPDAQSSSIQAVQARVEDLVLSSLRAIQADISGLRAVHAALQSEVSELKLDLGRSRHTRSGTTLVHDFSQHTPDCPIECGAPADTYDEALMRRIAAALRRSLARTTAAGDDIWTPIIANHQHFVELLTTGKLRAANDLLARMFATSLTYGFEQYRTDELVVANPAHQQHIRQLAFDKLLSLAAFLRAIPVQTVEQGDFLPYLRESPDSLLERIEAKLQREISAPRFHGGLFGITTRRGVFTERSLMAIYVALRIRELLHEVRSPSICEIGGGVGYVAYYCNWLGLTDYTIVDLPTVSAVQAYFLSQNLGGADRIALSGEPGGRPDRVELISGADFSCGTHKFDLIVNVDSFPEMSGPIVRGYLDRDHSRFRYLLSINQEAMAQRSVPHDRQERVGDVVDEIGGFRRLYRFPFWMRPGYVEEVYEATDAPA
jgi:hypothetical protein